MGEYINRSEYRSLNDKDTEYIDRSKYRSVNNISNVTNKIVSAYSNPNVDLLTGDSNSPELTIDEIEERKRQSGRRTLNETPQQREDKRKPFNETDQGIIHRLTQVLFETKQKEAEDYQNENTMESPLFDALIGQKETPEKRIYDKTYQEIKNVIKDRKLVSDETIKQGEEFNVLNNMASVLRGETNIRPDAGKGVIQEEAQQKTLSTEVPWMDPMDPLNLAQIVTGSVVGGQAAKYVGKSIIKGVLKGAGSEAIMNADEIAKITGKFAKKALLKGDVKLGQGIEKILSKRKTGAERLEEFRGKPIPMDKEIIVPDKDLHGANAMDDLEAEKTMIKSRPKFFKQLEDTTLEKVGKATDYVKKKFTRKYQELDPDIDGQLIYDLNLQGKQGDIQGFHTGRKLNEVIGSIKNNANDFDLFNRKIVLDDMKNDFERGVFKQNPDGTYIMPKGFTPEVLERNSKIIDDKIKGNTSIEYALKKRKEMWDELRNDYIKYIKPYKPNVEEIFKNDAYFRHDTLKYLDDKGLFGSGVKLKSPANRSFLKLRSGEYDGIYNMDYLSTEYGIVAQMRHDIETAKLITNIDKGYNISKVLRKEAKEEGIKDWKDLIPKGYGIYQPTKGHAFRKVMTVDEDLAAKLMDGEISSLVGKDVKVREALALGKKRKELVLPDNVINSIEHMNRERLDNFVSNADIWVMDKWKQYQTHAPHRLPKFTLRNMIGDSEAVFVGNPQAFKDVPMAMAELVKTFIGKKELEGDLLEWFGRGGMSSSFQHADLQALNKVSDFVNRNYGSKEFPNLFSKYWKTVRMGSDLREAILRYANFKNFKKQIIESGGKVPNYAASNPKYINSLADVNDKAFAMSNDLLGAYDNISQAGQVIRERWIPFWSFPESNFSRFKQMAVNAANNPEAMKDIQASIIRQGITKSVMGAASLARFTVKAAALNAVLLGINKKVNPEAEELISKDIGRTPHVLLGKDSEGDIRYLNRIGSTGDLIEWFGLDYYPELIRQWKSGKYDMPTLLKKFGKASLTGAANKIVQGAIPLSKVATETYFRQGTFPSVTDKKAIRDRGQHIAQHFGMQEIYNAAFNLPSKGLGSALSDIVISKINEGDAAYRDWYEMKNQWFESRGEDKDGYLISDIGNNSYNMFLANKWDDKDAFRKAIGNIAAADPSKLGGSISGIAERLNPLNGLGNQSGALFLKQLNDEEKDIFNRAIEHWKNLTKNINDMPFDEIQKSLKGKEEETEYINRKDYK